MIEKELSKIWQSSPHQEQVKFKKSRLILEVDSNLDRFHGETKWLHLREALGAIIAIPIFGYFGFTAPYLLTKIGALLMVLWATYILLVIKRTKKKKPAELSENYLQYLLKTKEYLQLQIKLRLSIFTWYVLPCMTFSYVFALGFFLENPEATKLIVGGGVYCLFIGYMIYFLNRRSAKKVVEPKLNKVNELINTLEEKNHRHPRVKN
ncbi:hypothetical protein [Ekhidna sp.]|uniref:hypothetical protein n=1 Tax=Ekhidna sp. TaxID=2608089 RepID=UPI00329A4780